MTHLHKIRVRCNCPIQAVVAKCKLHSFRPCMGCDFQSTCTHRDEKSIHSLKLSNDGQNVRWLPVRCCFRDLCLRVFLGSVAVCLLNYTHRARQGEASDHVTVMTADIENFIFLLHEFADRAKHGAIYAENVKFRVYTRRLLTALDGISATCSDQRLLNSLIDTAESVACVNDSMAEVSAGHKRRASKSESPGYEDRAAQLREVGSYLVMDCVNRIYQRGVEVPEVQAEALFPVVLRAATLLRGIACSPQTEQSWETFSAILWECIVPLLPTCWHRHASHQPMLSLLVDAITDGLQFLPACEDKLCNLVSRLTTLYHQSDDGIEPQVRCTHESSLPCSRFREAVNVQVYDVIISWVRTISGNLSHHGLPHAFVCALEAWLVQLTEHCTEPRQRQELNNAATDFSDTVVTLLMDTGDHAMALERLGYEHLSSRSQPLSAQQVSNIVRCMFARNQQPWNWITTFMAVNGHSFPWAEILHACIWNCQCQEPDQQATVSLRPMPPDARMLTTKFTYTYTYTNSVPGSDCL